MPNVLSSTPTSGSTPFSQQLNDIYGATGGEIYNFLQSIGGVDSAVLQDYIASLQPQMATAQANTNASLGAGGVGANSSVAAIATSNLQGQESAAIASESAKLTQSQEQLTADMLMHMAPTAAQQVADKAAMPFEIASSVLGALPGIGSALGNFISGYKSVPS